MISITPWRTEPEDHSGLHVEDATGTHVCTVWEMDRPPEECLDNLNLIVAAPDLLSCAWDFIQLIDIDLQVEGEDRKKEQLFMLREKVEDSIMKATKGQWIKQAEGDL